MVAHVTNGIKVSVSVNYSNSGSNPGLNFFLFSYKIKIENSSDLPVQLLRRHWYIFDSLAEKREVEGVGVIGQQPLILPGHSFEYQSSCDLTSEMGNMYGTYTMQNSISHKLFEIEIPRFELIAPCRLN